MTESLQVSAQLTTVQRGRRHPDRQAARPRPRPTSSGGRASSSPSCRSSPRPPIEALKAFPQLNASINTETKEIIYHGDVHLAIAVDTPRGLLVPVIKNAEDLNIAGLAKRIADVAARTRDNKIGPNELCGGTFTITNIGSVGALFDTPIINQPQVAILGTGAIVKQPAVITGPDGDDVIAIRSMCYLPLTYDHRLVDGADAGRFVSAIRARLEEGAFEAELGLGLTSTRRRHPRTAGAARVARGAVRSARITACASSSAGSSGSDRNRPRRPPPGGGHDVLRLVRRPPAAPDERGWDPPAGRIDEGTFDGVDAVVNLGGVGIGDRPWSGARKQLVRDSRNVPTEVLAPAVAEHGVPALLNASGINYYGDTGSRLVDETAPDGAGFLAEVCRDWEAATAPAAAAGARVVLLRSAAVLVPGRRPARHAAAAVPARAGRADRLRRPVLPVDLAGRRGRRDPVPAPNTTRSRAGQPGRPGAGHQRGVHPALAAAVGRPAPLAVPAFALKAVLGADGRGDGAHRAAGRARRAAGRRLPVPAPHAGRRPLRGGRAR